MATAHPRQLRVIPGGLAESGPFVIGRHGDLGWTGVPEVWWLLVLVAAAACGWALGRLRHHW